MSMIPAVSPGLVILSALPLSFSFSSRPFTILHYLLIGEHMIRYTCLLRLCRNRSHQLLSLSCSTYGQCLSTPQLHALCFRSRYQDTAILRSVALTSYLSAVKGSSNGEVISFKRNGFSRHHRTKKIRHRRKASRDPTSFIQKPLLICPKVTLVCYSHGLPNGSWGVKNRSEQSCLMFEQSWR